MFVFAQLKMVMDCIPFLSTLLMALGAGGRGFSGGFGNLKKSEAFWTSSRYDIIFPVLWGVTYTNANISHGHINKTIGYSVRCVLNE